MYSQADARYYEVQQKVRTANACRQFLSSHESEIIRGRVLHELTNKELTDQANRLYPGLGSVPRGYVAGVLRTLTVPKVQRVKKQRYLGKTAAQIAEKYQYPYADVEWIFRVMDNHAAREKAKIEAEAAEKEKVRLAEIAALERRVKELEEKPKEVIQEIVREETHYVYRDREPAKPEPTYYPPTRYPSDVTSSYMRDKYDSYLTNDYYDSWEEYKRRR